MKDTQLEKPAPTLLALKPAPTMLATACRPRRQPRVREAAPANRARARRSTSEAGETGPSDPRQGNRFRDGTRRMREGPSRAAARDAHACVIPNKAAAGFRFPFPSLAPNHRRIRALSESFGPARQPPGRLGRRGGWRRRRRRGAQSAATSRARPRPRRRYPSRRRGRGRAQTPTPPPPPPAAPPRPAPHRPAPHRTAPHRSAPPAPPRAERAWRDGRGWDCGGRRPGAAKGASGATRHRRGRK